MENLRKGLSDIFSLLIQKENNGYYSWSEIAVGLILIGFLCLALSFFH